MKAKLLSFSVLLTVALSLVSCDHDPIDDVKRKGINVPEVVLASPVGITNMSNSIYGVFRGGHFGLRNFALGILADENDLVDAGSSGRGFDEIRNVGAEGAHFNNWFFYASINQINQILDAVDKVNALSLSERNRIKGELFAMRAYLHMEMAKVYSYFPGNIPTSGVNSGFNQGIPYLTTFNVDAVNPTVPPRETIDVTYQKIIADLQQSLTFFRAMGEAPSLARGSFFITRASAFGLLARASLYSGNWALAGQAADSCLRWCGYDPAATMQTRMPRLTGVADYAAGNFATGWSSSSAHVESILEAQYAIVAERRGSESLAGIYIEGTGGNGWGDYILSNEQFNAYARFADGTLVAAAGAGTPDVRAGISGGLGPNVTGAEPTALTAAAGQTATTMLIRYSRPRGGVYRTINKWRTTKGTYGWHNVPLMRVSEIRLIRAEALARQGQDAAALTEVNALRGRRSAVLYVGAPSGQAMLDIILHERRLELLAEGHRFFDLKRTSQTISKPAAYVTVQLGQREALAPIPLSEQLLSGVPQNRGY